MKLTPWERRELKVDSRIAIHLRCRSKVELISRDVTVRLIPNIECGRSQNVVMNLLRRATILEDEGHSFFAGRDL
jgi:hypothetical protein